MTEPVLPLQAIVQWRAIVACIPSADASTKLPGLDLGSDHRTLQQLKRGDRLTLLTSTPLRLNACTLQVPALHATVVQPASANRHQ
jgi:hypothetical protein